MDRKGFMTLFIGIAIGIIIGYLSAVILTPGKPEPQPVPSTEQRIRGEMERFLLDKQKEVEKNPEDIQARTNLANILFDLNRYKEAAGHYIEVLKKQPDNLSVMSDLGICFRKLGNPNRAIESFRKVVEKDPNHVVAWYNIAVTSWYDLKDINTAKTAIEKVIKIDPFYSNTIKLKAELDATAGR